MPEKRMEIGNCARTEVRGQCFVTFDVAMQGHVISTIDAPMLSGRILWSHAAIYGYCDFDPSQRTELEAEVGRRLSGDIAARNDECTGRHDRRH